MLSPPSCQEGMGEAAAGNRRRAAHPNLSIGDDRPASFALPRLRSCIAGGVPTSPSSSSSALPVVRLGTCRRAGTGTGRRPLLQMQRHRVRDRRPRGISANRAARRDLAEFSLAAATPARLVAAGTPVPPQPGLDYILWRGRANRNIPDQVFAGGFLEFENQLKHGAARVMPESPRVDFRNT